MLAQWISIAAQDGFRKARTSRSSRSARRRSPSPGFRSVVLGQLGESRLVAAIDTDIAGEQAHAKALDADTKGAAAGHPPARRHRDPLRVVGRADRQGRAPARAALRPRRARAGHDVDRQRRVRARSEVLLHPQGGLGRLPDRLPADDEEGGERPARVARRGERDQTRSAHPGRE